MATAGRRDRARHLARHRRARAAGHLEIGNGIQQHAGIGMPRAAEQGARLAPLDEAAKIHDADEVGDVIDYGEIVADEKVRSEEHTSELQSLMRISYAVFCLKKKKKVQKHKT